jgi:hypothetical protein
VVAPVESLTVTVVEPLATGVTENTVVICMDKSSCFYAAGFAAG